MARDGEAIVLDGEAVRLRGLLTHGELLNPGAVGAGISIVAEVLSQPI